MALLSALCASMACQSIKLGNRQCWQSWAGSQLLNVDIMHISILARLVKIFSFVHIFQQLCWLHLISDVYEFSATLFSSFGKTLLHTRFGKRVGVYLWCKCTCLWYSVFSAIIYFFFLVGLCLTVLSEISVDQGSRRIGKHDIPEYVYVCVYVWGTRDCFNNFDVITSQQSTVEAVGFWLFLTPKWTVLFSLDLCLICSFKWITIFYLYTEIVGA